jgi:hypothetical protein
MLDPRSANIEYASQSKMMSIYEGILSNTRLGRTARFDKWSTLISARKMLQAMIVKNRLSEESKTDSVFLYDCLIETLGLNAIPAAPASVIIQAPTLLVGIPGPPGAAGTSAYLYIAYATDSSGSGYSVTPAPTRKWIAILNSSSPILAVTAANFSGLWQKYIGEDGTNGTNGTNGINGINGRSLLSGTTNPTPSTGSDGDFYINTSTWQIFGPKVTVWPSGVSLTGPAGPAGTSGTNGLDGKSLRYGGTGPLSGDGFDGDFWIDTTAWMIYGPKSGGAWPAGVSIIGPIGATGAAGTPGSNGSSGTSAYIYVAYADDINGSGYTLVQSNDNTASLTAFNPNKEWMAILINASQIGTTITMSSFTGLWAKYAGNGDRWATYSTTSLTIATGTQSLFIEQGLSYTTGQRIVIALDGSPGNRMEGYVISYNGNTGQFSVDIDDITGSGTHSVWDVNLQSSLPNTTEIPFSNTDVDTGTEDVDTFTSSLSVRVEWEYVIEKGVNTRGGVISAIRNGTTMVWSDISGADIGTVDVELTVDVDAGNIRLRAIATSDDWTVKGLRRMIAA